MPMKTKWLVGQCIRTVSLLLALTLGACDGGLFGTGDGVTANNSIAGSTDPLDMQLPTETSGDTSLGISPIATPEMDTLDGVAFDNTLVTTLRSDPLLNVVNLSDRTLALSLDTQNALLLDQPGLAPGAISELLVLPVGTNTLRLLNANDSNRVFFTIDPLNVGASTLTTLIVRELDNGVDVVPLATQITSDDATLARLRLVQGVPLSDNTTVESELRLVPAGENPGAAEVSYAGISFDNPASAYLSVPAGDYLLQDAQSRFPPQPLTVVGGGVYTVIIIGTDEPVLLIQVNSDNSDLQ